MIVYLLRHGNAEDCAPGGGDAARALTDEGRERLQRASRGWRRIVGKVDRVLASPLLRAQQTATIFQRAVCKDAAIDTEPALQPDMAPLDALVLLQSWCAKNATGVALVGHEPHLGSLLGLLLTGRERTAVPFKKGMLVAVELDGSTAMVGRLVAALSQRVAGER